MIKEEIVKQMIEKAVENNLGSWLVDYNRYKVSISKEGIVTAIMNTDSCYDERIFHINEVLFNQKFCKAFWGKKWICNISLSCLYSRCSLQQEKDCGHGIEEWKYHGQQMFLSEDRLEYIKKFL